MKITDERPEDEITAEDKLDAMLNRAFAASMPLDRAKWKRSLERLGKAQARLWHETPIKVRQMYLAAVDHSEKGTP